MSTTPRLIRLSTVAATACLAATGLALAAGSAAATPVQRATRLCDFPNNGSQYPSSKAQFNELRVTNVSCRYGVRFLKPYWRCRTARSVRGECRRKVLGFTCREGRRRYETLGSRRVSYAVRVTCRRGSQRIVLAYEQQL